MRQLGVALWLVACSLPHAHAADDLGQFLNARGLVPAAPTAVFAPDSAPLSATPLQPDGPRQAQRMSELVVAAMGSLGIAYRRGGSSFEGGYDCSGFVQAIYEQNTGVRLPRQAAQQATATHVIDRDRLQPGDLVFFNTLRRAYSHVGIYVGDYKFIHSPKSGAVVRIEDMRVGYWNSRFDGARRVVGGESTPVYSAAPPAYPNY